MIVTSFQNGVPGQYSSSGQFVPYTDAQKAQLQAYAGSAQLPHATQGALMDATNQAASRVGTQGTDWQWGADGGVNRMTPYTPPAPAPNNGPFVIGGTATRTTSSQTNPYMPSSTQPQPTQQTGQTNPYTNPLGTPTTAATGTGVTNPYMQLMSNAITQTANQNLTRNLLPSIGRGAVAMGGYGDSRQGIAQGIAMGDTQQGITNALGGLYGNAYNVDRSYDLSRIGQDQGFYTAQRGQDIAQQQASTNQYLQALNAMTGLGSQVAGIGGQQMQQSLYPLQQLSSLLNPYTGLNQTNTNQQPGSGGGLAGALGGGLTAAQIYQLLNGG